MSTCQSWQDVYAAALGETNLGLLMNRVDTAYDAVRCRMADLRGIRSSEAEAERSALTDAMRALAILTSEP